MLTIDNSGESPQIPSEVVDYTNQYLAANSHSVGVSVTYLTTIGKEGCANNGNHYEFSV